MRGNLSGAWSEQVLVGEGGRSKTLTFLHLAPGTIRLSNYSPGKTDMQQKHLNPVNLYSHQVEAESFLLYPHDTGSPGLCPGVPRPSDSSGTFDPKGLWS